MTSPVERIRAYHAELKLVRHDLHAHPELAFTETRTSDLVAEKLAGWGIEVHRGLARTGVVGIIKGKSNVKGRGVGLRADMDCLPIHETGAVPYRGAGGHVMVKEGLFEKFPANEVYALHNWPGLAPGKIAVGAGPMMAATDEVQVTVRGKGGHGAMPHLVVDPVVAAAQIITALQTIASRNVDPTDAVVVSICSMQTSQVGAFNVVPESVRLVGTVRSFRPETRDLAERRLREIVIKVAEALGGSAQIDYMRGYPATVNSVREAAFAAAVGERIFGKGNVITDPTPTMGGEDFSYMLAERPGAYVWLGQGGGPGGCFLHHPSFDFNDEVIPLGAGYLAALVEEALPLEEEK